MTMWRHSGIYNNGTGNDGTYNLGLNNTGNFNRGISNNGDGNQGELIMLSFILFGGLVHMLTSNCLRAGTYNAGQVNSGNRNLGVGNTGNRNNGEFLESNHPYVDANTQLCVCTHNNALLSVCVSCMLPQLLWSYQKMTSSWSCHEQLLGLNLNLLHSMTLNHDHVSCFSSYMPRPPEAFY